MSIPSHLVRRPGVPTRLPRIVTDGSSQLVHTLLGHGLVDRLHLLLYPVTVGGGKRLFPEGVQATFRLTGTRAYPSGVVGLEYER